MKYIAIWQRTAIEANPYYSEWSSQIEPSHIEVTHDEFRICETPEQLNAIRKTYPKAKFYEIGNEVEVKESVSLAIKRK